MAGVENTNISTPAPPVDSKPTDAGSSWMVTPSTADSTPQGSPDQPAPLRHGTWKTENWLPWRHWNFSLLAATSPSSIWDALVSLCIGLHIISCLYTNFWGSTAWIHSTYTITCLPSTIQFWYWGNSFNVISIADLWMVGEWTKDYLAQVQLSHCGKKIPTQYPHRDPVIVWQPHSENWLTDISKCNNNMSPGAHCVTSGINTTESLLTSDHLNMWLSPWLITSSLFFSSFTFYKFH